MIYEGNEQYDVDKRPNINAPLIRAVSGCVKRNVVLTKLALEGLTVTVDYVRIITTVTPHPQPRNENFNYSSRVSTF